MVMYGVVIKELLQDNDVTLQFVEPIIQLFS